MLGKLFVILPICFTALFAGSGTNLQSAIKATETKAIALQQKKNVPGFAMGVVKGGQIVYAKGFGVRNINTGDPVNADTVFQLGSVSKVFAGTLVGILLERKFLHLDNKIKQYLPHYEFHDDTSLRHVVTHTTGIPRYGFNAMIESGKKSREEVMDRLTKTELKCSPGTCYDYHNAMFSLVDMIIESAMGMSYEQVLQNYLLIPLGMTHTSLSHDDLLQHDNRAVPHIKTQNGTIACKGYRTEYYDFAPTAGVNTSLNDMLKFLQAALGHKTDVVSHATLKLIHTPLTAAKDIFERNPGNHKRFNASSYGIGWRILDYQGHKIVFHGGWVKGFINIIALLPEQDVGIVVLQNTETSFPWIVAMNFFDQVLGFPDREWDRKGAVASPLKKIKKQAQIQKQQKQQSNKNTKLLKAEKKPTKAKKKVKSI